MRAYIGLGSNVGDRLDFLRFGARELRKLSSDGKISFGRVYETEPWGNIRQENFLNTVAAINTGLAPAELMEALKRIEILAGRKPFEQRNTESEKWGPRTLDLDILLLGNLRLDGEVTIPHPRMLQRRFVLAPLADLAPDLVIAGTSTTAIEALKSCSDEGWIKIHSEGLEI